MLITFFSKELFADRGSMESLAVEMSPLFTRVATYHTILSLLIALVASVK